MSFPRDASEFEITAHKFLNELELKLQVNDISPAFFWSIDHLCYRTATQADYEAACTIFRTYADLLIESPVNGRPISTFKLRTPLKWKNWHIPVVEIPAPKQNKSAQNGFEHIEIVCDVPFDTLKKKYAQLKINVTGLKKYFNQEFEIEFGDMAVKFHHVSLQSVVLLEKNKKVFSAIQNSEVLVKLHRYDPLIAGTFPLGVTGDKSDVDILISSKNLAATRRVFEKHFEGFNNYHVKETSKYNVPSIICNFEFEDIPFEIFAQDLPSVQQAAYKHFLLEERILNLANDKFRQAIVACRKEGMKTEPAFAKVLKLDGDPYLALLQLFEAPEEKLISLLHNAELPL